MNCDIDKVDVTFDFRTDSKGMDPDSASATLRAYHKKLWSKLLPNKEVFNLSYSIDDYLCFQSKNQKIRVSSDWLINTYLHWDFLAEIKKQFQEDKLEEFSKISRTIGGHIIFPVNPLGTSGQTINRIRGTKKEIKDRFDLTLECIRRYYNKKNEINPLGETLKRFNNYFELFVDFKGYCDFFFLQDLVSADYEKVNFLLDFKDFGVTPALPNQNNYLEYMRKSIEFIEARNARILKEFR